MKFVLDETVFRDGLLSVDGRFSTQAWRVERKELNPRTGPVLEY